MLLLITCLMMQVEPTTAEIRDPNEPQTAEQFCESVYADRLKQIDDVQIELAALPDKNDWDKLSDEGRKKLSKPFIDKITSLRAKRDIDWPVGLPLNFKHGDTFKFPRTHKTLAINDQFYVLKSIDKNSVLAQADELVVRRSKVGLGDVVVVIEDLKPGEFLDKSNAPLKLSGLWYRKDELKLDGTTHLRIARWPHEEAVRKLWPKFLKAKENKPAGPQKKTQR